MNYIVNSKNMYRAELSAVNRGTTFTDLMEKAGSECAKIIYNDCCKGAPKSVLIICGKGKNGGDGFVIARHLCEMGLKCTVLLAMDSVGSGDPLLNYERLQESITTLKYSKIKDDLETILGNTDIVVDALFGTGFKGELPSELRKLALNVKNSGKTLVSIDVPSGANCDTGETVGDIFAPHITIAISALKPVHIIKPFSSLCGKIKIADIGITDSDFLSLESPHLFTLYDEDIKALLPKRKAVSNKGDYGHALCAVGSYKMPGAAVMSISGALKSGAGLVTAAFPKSIYNVISTSLKECLISPHTESEEGTFCKKSASEILQNAKKYTAALIGCGMGLNESTKEFTAEIIKSFENPLVLDADGLNAIASIPEILKERRGETVITPHPGEMARLTGKSVKEILENPIDTAIEFSKKYNCTVVLKGANALVAHKSSSKVYVNQTGNSGLAKGGSGDLLSGMLVSLLAQGMTPFEASICSVYMHGDCADLTAKRTSKRGMTVSDIINLLPEYYGKFE